MPVTLPIKGSVNREFAGSSTLNLWSHRERRVL